MQHEVFAAPLISSKVAFSEETRCPPEFVQCVLGLTQYLSYPEMSVKAFAMLNAHFGQKTDLIRLMTQTQIVVMDDVAQQIGALRNEVSLLRGQAKWLTSPEEAQRKEAFETSNRILARWCTLLVPQGAISAVEVHPASHCP